RRTTCRSRQLKGRDALERGNEPHSQSAEERTNCRIASFADLRILQSSAREGKPMKIVVIGGTGLIGSKTVTILRQRGHDGVAASPNTGVNTITGEGLKEAIAGAQVVVDLANSPSFEDKVVLEFFETSERNLLPAEAAAGIRHHVALSIVGIDRSDNGYFRAK